MLYLSRFWSITLIMISKALCVCVCVLDVQFHGIIMHQHATSTQVLCFWTLRGSTNRDCIASSNQQRCDLGWGRLTALRSEAIIETKWTPKGLHGMRQKKERRRWILQLRHGEKKVVMCFLALRCRLASTASSDIPYSRWHFFIC